MSRGDQEFARIRKQAMERHPSATPERAVELFTRDHPDVHQRYLAAIDRDAHGGPTAAEVEAMNEAGRERVLQLLQVAKSGTAPSPQPVTKEQARVARWHRQA